MPRPKKQPAIAIDLPPVPAPESIGLSTQPLPPAQPSPAVLSLQQQVVDLVSKRTEAREKLTQSHTAYLTAQGQFQAAQAELQGIEQEVQYRIGLIAQLENRTPLAPVIQMPAQQIIGVSAEPPRADVALKQVEDNISRGHASRDPNALVSRMM